ncbi:hypothetical protein HanXRQr2_Chr02g0083581 [Helianthus annuus]|uniref:Uncharacterized protein n=1 Tax=Helianthus annuus TaxID=4232 RepID=A0A9K3P105_HELAN|nr:hypothetical protein HanXRQr2_Chr02g0083581 [Helianthus annuus]
MRCGLYFVLYWFYIVWVFIFVAFWVGEVGGGGGGVNGLPPRRVLTFTLSHSLVTRFSLSHPLTLVQLPWPFSGNSPPTSG